jgi:hypothetical protein
MKGVDVMDAVLMAQIGISIFIGAPAIFVVLSRRYQHREKMWAFSTLGLILGYWLRGKA